MAIIGDPIDPQSASYAGQLVAQLPGFRAQAALRSSAGTKRLLRCTVTAPTSGQTYSIRGRAPGLPWRTAEFTTSSTAAADLRDGLIAAWNALDGVDFAVVSAAGSGTAIDAEALAAGSQNPIEFEVVADPTSDLSAFAVIAAGADAFEASFGRYLAVTGYSEASDAARPVVGELTAAAGPVVTTTIAVDTNGDTFVLALFYNGVLTSVTWDADTDTATTVPIAVAAIEAALPNATVSGVTGTGVITTALPVGETVAVADASAQGSSTISNSVAAGDDPVELALVLDPADIAPASIGADVTEIPAGRAVTVLKGGRQDVGVEDPGEAIAFGGIVWVETADGANKGRPYASAAPSRQKVADTAAKWVRDDEVSPDLSFLRIIDLG